MEPSDTPIETQFLERSVAAWRSPEFIAGLFAFQGMFRLSIWRKDFAPEPMSWEELQAVKSACGFGHVEAFEIYPRDGEVVNTANGRHLYIAANPLMFAMKVNPGALWQNNPPDVKDTP